MENYQRKCPKCDSVLTYSNKSNYKKALIKNCLCNSCAQKSYTHSRKYTDFTRQCPRCKKELTYKNRATFLRATKVNCVCRSCFNYTTPNLRHTGKNHTIETRLKMSQRLKDYHPRKGKKQSAETIEKRSRSMREHKLSYYGKVNFNPKACEYFDKLNEEKGWNLQHALNGGEISVIGYSLDAYDKERNIVIEYDEPIHYHITGELKDKDLQRQKNIISFLKCQFYRFNERTGQLNIFALNESEEIN